MKMFNNILTEIYVRIHSECRGYYLTNIDFSTTNIPFVFPDATIKEKPIMYFSGLNPCSNTPEDVKPSLGILYVEKMDGFYVGVAKIFNRPAEFYRPEELALFSNGTLTLYPLREGENEEVFVDEKKYASKIAEHIIKAFKTMFDQ